MRRIDGATSEHVRDLDSAIRSLYEPVGLNHSSFTWTSAEPVGTTLSNRTTGVPPTTSVITEPARMTASSSCRAPDTVLITSTGERTFSTSAFSGDRARIGPSSTEARVAGDVILLRTGPTSLTAVRDGSEIWATTIEEDAMFNPVDGTVRIDRFTTFNTAGIPAYYQQESRVLDLETGVESRVSEMEVAIPLEGDQIDEPCVRTEIDEELLCAPSPLAA